MNAPVWQSCADDVLAVLVTEEYLNPAQTAYAEAIYEVGLLPYNFPGGKWRALMQAITDLRQARKAVNWNTLMPLVGAEVSQDWYTELVTLCDPVRLADFSDNVRLLIEHGNRMAVVESLETATAALRDGQAVETTVNTLITDVTTIGEEKITDETAGGSAERLRHIFENEPPTVVPTGIEFVDKAIGGMREQRMMVIAGAYKSRKTTLMLNFIWQAVRTGKSAAVLSFENSIETTMMQMIALLAVEWLLKGGRVPYAPDAPVYWLSADGLMQAGKGYKDWTALKAQAVDYARAELARIGDCLRFYDRSLTGGSLSGISSIRSVIRRDMRLYGGDVYALDHQGLVDADGEVYEHTRSVSKFLQGVSRITDPHSIHLMVLAQLNESTIANNGGYSAGVKGGGDTSANADYVLRTTPVAINNAAGEYYDDRIELQVKHNRWGVTTARNTVFFHPESGLVMPSRTIDLKTLTGKGNGS